MSRELPILFNTEMIQAILDDRKTATRRIAKPQPDGIYTTIKPKYQPGDILYARETWAFQCCIDCMDAAGDDSCTMGKAPTIHIDKDTCSEGCYIYRADHPYPERITWRPSIHMPEAAARIWLRVTGVKIQRLQDMTLDDFLREGINIRPEAFNDPQNADMQARDAFIRLWDSTIPKGQQALYGWEVNPWVWATEFERCVEPAPCIIKGMEPASDKIPCIGYQKSQTNDEPCEMCKGCKKCDGEESEGENPQ